jgi:hypothetical protein
MPVMVRVCTFDHERKPYVYAAGAAQKGEKKARLFSTGFEAHISCLRCEEIFYSTDKRSVRHCDRCRYEIARAANTIGVEAEET